jgi:hypothetical protein
VIKPTKLIEALGYDRSPNFLRAGRAEFNTAPALGHIFRRAAKHRGLQGVYTLRPPQTSSTAPPIPVLYVCEASSDSEADETHRLVWNQDVVPFLLVTTPDSVRLYSGFRHKRLSRGKVEGMLRALRDTNEILEVAESFHAEAIDNGTVWKRWGADIRPETRVDWKLLDNLKALDRWLQEDGLSQEISHALIGKYVYLHYLKDRDILSARKLASWDLDSGKIFGRSATLKEVGGLADKLDDWLNGSVFPLRFRGRNAPSAEQLRRVAATFAGDEPAGSAWQLHLDFQAYDFSYIPIETLSIVYEQFLHAPSPGEEQSRGREAGAYYTPIPVVNFMLAELEDRKPLAAGTRVLDPSCGSGAFLVQCYRRLIEREFPPGPTAPTPSRLRDLLERHIFGIDRDSDACSVTEMSLVLTLLDYVNPPDLENNKRFKLPSLREANILCENFFPKDESTRPPFDGETFEWVVGNPPWKRLNPKRLHEDDKPTWRWMSHCAARGTPIAGNQVAQAFAWEIDRCLEQDGASALLLPAIILFEDTSRRFRARFFEHFRVHSVANFANLAEVLFAGRSRVPAAAFFFSKRTAEDSINDEHVNVFSPLVANQEQTRPVVERKRSETWSLVLNLGEVRRVSTESLLNGSGRPWKLALWGSHLDAKLLEKLRRRLPTLGQLERDNLLLLSEGVQLRPRARKGGEPVTAVPELEDKPLLDVKALERLRHLFAFPSSAFSPVPGDRCFVRRGRVQLPMSVCRPPHVIVSAARTFAIYSEDFIVVPPRQIGIVSPNDDKALLKALAVYLNSDFAYYHQFLTSAELGVTRGRATLGSLRELPVPFHALSPSELERWGEIHDELVDLSSRLMDQEGSELPSLFSRDAPSKPLVEALGQLNDAVYSSLGLSDRERALVSDLVCVRLELNAGQLGRLAVDSPDEELVLRYAKRLKADLDAFVGRSLGKKHEVTVVTDEQSALVSVSLVENGRRAQTHVVSADSNAKRLLAQARERLRREHSQWVYFERNLRVLDGRHVYLLKPMQRFHWTESQAMFDAGEIIADTLNAAGARV